MSSLSAKKSIPLYEAQLFPNLHDHDNFFFFSMQPLLKYMKLNHENSA